MKVGYARVSTLDQNLDLQTDALKKEGCKEIFQDHASGAKADRDGLRKALDFMREGDTLVVWKLAQTRQIPQAPDRCYKPIER